MKKFISIIILTVSISFSLLGCGNININDKKVSDNDDTKESIVVKQILMLNNNLYYGTGNESDVGARCGNMDGKIASSVESTETPTENHQSNFGSDYGFQYVDENNIDVYMNDKWMRFVKE